MDWTELRHHTLLAKNVLQNRFADFQSYIRGHSRTTLTKFYPILGPSPLKWTNMDILYKIYPLLRDPRGLSTDPFSPPFLLLFNVIIEWDY